MIMIIILTKDISKVKVKIQKMKLVVTRLLSKRKKNIKKKNKRTPHAKKQKKKTKGIMDYINYLNILFIR